VALALTAGCSNGGGAANAARPEKPVLNVAVVAPWHGVRHSKDGGAAFFTDFGSTMEVEEFTPVSIAANDTDVLSVVRFRVRSRATGKTAAMDLHHWFTFRDGKIALPRHRGHRPDPGRPAGLTRGVVLVPAGPGG
jgi:SnoaL-like domain